MDSNVNYFYVLDQQGGARYISDWDAAKYDAHAKGTYPVGVFQSWVGIKLKTANREVIQDNINRVAKELSPNLIQQEKSIASTNNKLRDQNLNDAETSQNVENETKQDGEQRSKNADSAEKSGENFLSRENLLQLQQERRDRQNRLDVDVALLKKEVPALDEKMQSSVKILVDSLTSVSVAAANEAKQTQFANEQERKQVVDRLTEIFDLSCRLTEILREMIQNRTNIWEDLSANDVCQQRYQDYIDRVEVQNDRIVSLLNAAQIANAEAQEAIQEAWTRHNNFAQNIRMIAETLTHSRENYVFIYRKSL